MLEGNGKNSMYLTRQKHVHGRGDSTKTSPDKKLKHNIWSLPKAYWRQNIMSDQAENTIPSVKHGDGSFMLWGCFTSTLGNWSELKKKKKMNGAKYKEIVEGNYGSPPSNRTMTLNTASKEHYSGLRRTNSMSWSWSSYGKSLVCFKDCWTQAAGPTWRICSSLIMKNG